MGGEKIDPKAGVKPGDCWGTWSAKHEACSSKCAMRERCRHQTMRSGKAIPQTPAPALEEDLMAESTLQDMDPLEFLLAGLKGKFDSELVEGETFNTWRFRTKEGNGVARVLVSKASAQVRVDTKKNTLLFKEGLTSVRQAHGIIIFLLA